jgi:hypothetical protein
MGVANGHPQVRLHHRSFEDAELMEPTNRFGSESASAMVHSALSPARTPGHPQLPMSPNIMTRPFHSMLRSAEKRRHEVHTAAAMNSGLVYVPTVGLVRLVPLGNLASQPQGAGSGLQSFPGRLEAIGVPAHEAAGVSAELETPFRVHSKLQCLEPLVSLSSPACRS